MLGKLFSKKKSDLASELQEELEQKGSSSAPVLEIEEEGPGWMDRLKGGLSKTRGGWVQSISSVFGSSIDEDSLEEFEELLIEGDLGVSVTMEFVDLLRDKLDAGELKDSSDVSRVLKEAIEKELSDSLSAMNMQAKPFSVVLMVGINGVGKTTTTAKLTHLFQKMNKKCMLVACDTFRAGAVEQLKTWGSRLDCEVVCGKEGQDPASVAFDGIQRAKEADVDVVIIDTAGRLHTQTNLMEEVKKISRVLSRQCDGAPHECLMVLDATTGQNAINQARIFHEALKLSGVVMTKLDGTARGGSLIGIHKELKIPIRFIGVGEQMQDLQVFHPTEYTEALFAQE